MTPTVAFIVREAAEADSRALAQLQVDSSVTTYLTILPEEYLAAMTYADGEREWRQLLARQSGEIVLVAALPNGEIAGYAQSWPEPGEVQGFDAELNAIHVRNAQRRRGIGTALLRETARRLRSRGCGSLMTWTFEQNRGACLWCERLGAKTVAEGEWSGNQDYEIHVHEVAYAWDDLSDLLDEARRDAEASRV